ncbi:VOC family protein [Erythrobacter crassostreae]|uniref:VOC family protein n=1 Tax=Erythrobacter crassostreae TaxID=2828328 RepID=A0A9X1F2X7_9SPHN|nr:VOC family protein [Erythrobacter crassostrea]MBV7258664.1 VOC family protein [Erythrobacter crassostrea]
MQTQPAQAAPAAAEAILGVHHVGITVSDIDETVAFYSAAVDFDVIERTMVDASALPSEILNKREGQIEMALVETPTVFLVLVDIEPDGAAEAERRSVSGPGYTHICWQTQTDNSGYKRFREAGMEMLSRGHSAIDLLGQGVTYAYGFDPDGTMIEMEQLERPRRQDDAWLTHIANVPGDKAAMVDFYTKILGYGPHRELEETRIATIDDVVDIDGTVVTASWFATWNFELEFWNFKTPPTPVSRTDWTLERIGYNSLSFEVTDLDGTITRLEPQGIEFAGPAFTLGGWKMRYARDPEGNLLAFQQNIIAGRERSIYDKRWHDPASYPLPPL